MSSTVLVPGQLFANIAFAVPPNNPFVRAPAPTTRTRKKIPVNLPQETLFFGDGRLPTRRSHFARTPIPPRLIPPQAPVLPPDVTSADVYPPPDSLRVGIADDNIRVSLPGRSAWDALRNKFMDEELEKLSVEENDTDIDVSISSPVDPALLSFKLNKLQQAQNSHPDDVPDEAEEEQEPDSEEQAVTEVDEAEVSRIAVSGADDTIDFDMELEDEENGRGSRNGNGNNANLAGEDEGEVQQNPRRAVQIEDRLEALLETKLDGFREEVRALRAEGLSTSHALHDKTSELLVLHHDALSRFMGASGKTKKLADAVTREEQSMIATNSDLQVKVQAEKDIMLERISSKIDQLRAKVYDIQAVMLPRTADATTSRPMELDETPSQSSSQFESKRERLLDPENLVGELEVVSKVHSQEAHAGFASRETDVPVDALAALRKEDDAQVSQQNHWDDFRRTNEPELKELHCVCDRSKVLECEYAALQRRYKEQEMHVASSDRAAITARESLAQAQQLAAEWEQRANESARALEEAQAARDQAQDRAVRLEAEHVLLRMQLDEKERLAKERESNLSDKVAALEAQLMAADAARLDCVTQ